MTSRHPDALVFALCHEVGNLLTAMRLRADALRPDSAEVEAAAAAVSSLATRSAALLAQVRPLLAGPEATAVVSPAEALARLELDLSDAGGTRARVGASQAAHLSVVECDPELLHQLLIAASLAAAEESGVGEVGISAEARGDRVVITVSHAGPDRSGPEPRRPSGLALVRVVADAILGRLGGRAALGPGRLELELPAAASAVGSG